MNTINNKNFWRIARVIKTWRTFFYKIILLNDYLSAIFYFKTQVLSSYKRRFKFKPIWFDEPCWRIRNNRMTSKAFEIRNVYRKRGKAREYKEKRGEKILCMVWWLRRVKFLSFLIVQLSLFRTVGLLFEKKEKRNLKRKFKCF